MLPLRSVGKSNFVMVCVNKLNNVDSKATYYDENCCIIYIYIYIYMYVPKDVGIQNTQNYKLR